MSLSQGVTNYVDDMQNDMLTGNPITIDETGINIASFMETMSMREKQDALQYAYKDGHINIFALLENLVKRQEQLTSFGIKMKLMKFTKLLSKRCQKINTVLTFLIIIIM